MKEVTLTLIEEGDDGSFWNLSTDGFSSKAAQLPKREKDGKRIHGLGRFKPGKYRCLFTPSPSRKNPDGTAEWTYRLLDVPDAEGVLIHPGNFAGDKLLGFATDVEGCVILGVEILEIEITPAKRQHQPWIAAARLRQKGVSSSKLTVAAFVAHMNKEPFDLIVKEAA